MSTSRIPRQSRQPIPLEVQYAQFWATVVVIVSFVGCALAAWAAVKVRM